MMNLEELFCSSKVHQRFMTAIDAPLMNKNSLKVHQLFTNYIHQKRIIEQSKVPHNSLKFHQFVSFNVNETLMNF